MTLEYASTPDQRPPPHMTLWTLGAAFIAFGSLSLLLNLPPFFNMQWSPRTTQLGNLSQLSDVILSTGNIILTGYCIASRRWDALPLAYAALGLILIQMACLLPEHLIYTVQYPTDIRSLAFIGAVIAVGIITPIYVFRFLFKPRTIDALNGPSFGWVRRHDRSLIHTAIFIVAIRLIPPATFSVLITLYSSTYINGSIATTAAVCLMAVLALGLLFATARLAFSDDHRVWRVATGYLIVTAARELSALACNPSLISYRNVNLVTGNSLQPVLLDTLKTSTFFAIALYIAYRHQHYPRRLR